MGRSRLSIGSSAAAALSQEFSATDYVPPELQSDFATGEAYYNSFQQAASGVSFGSGGRVTLSPAAQQAVAGAIEGAVIASVPVLGEAFAVLLAVAPSAGGGAGVCASSPPAGPLLSQLESWPHFQSWESWNGPYPAGAAGSFESFANPVLEYNWLLSANCYANKAGSSPTILAALVASWNAKHSSSSRRTITRSGLVPAGFTGRPAGYDPIAEALEQAILAKYTPTAATQTFEQATSGEGGYTGPHNASSSFTVNAGPLVLKPLTLRFGPSSGVQLPVTAKLVGPPLAASGPSGTTIVVLGAAAAAGWWFLVKRKPLPKIFR